MHDNFLFLELLDAEINGLLFCIRELASGSAKRTNIHVTLRGPYAGPVPLQVMRRVERSLLKDTLLIANPGVFRNGATYVVYLAVTHRYLQSVSWKRDFPVKDFGFNPHITLYAGENGSRAETLLEFLKEERIELICSEFRVTTYARSSPPLIEEESCIQFFYPRLLNAGRIRADLLLRLKHRLRAPVRS